MSGVALGTSDSNGAAEPESQDDDWPWIWAMHDTEVLDWRRGLSKEETQAQRQLQSQPPAELSRCLMIGDARSAACAFALEAFCVTHVLNMAGQHARGPTDAYGAAGIRYKEIAAEDEDGYPLLERHLEDARAFIGEAREAGGRCLVHCAAGLNRSGTIVAAEVMLHEGRTVLDVVSQCRRARGNLFLSNRSFQEELVALARRHSLLGVVPGEEGSVVPRRAPPSETCCPKDASEPSRLRRREPAKPLAKLYDG